MNLQQREAKSKRLVLIWILGFFGTIFLMNFYMVSRAVSTFNGTVAKKSYQQGINYNDVLAQRKQIIAEGLSQNLDLKLDNKSLDLDVNLMLKHSDKNYKMPNNVVLDFWRPTNEGQDFKVSLYDKKNYSTTVNFKENQMGIWNIKYTLNTLDGTPVEFVNRVDVR